LGVKLDECHDVVSCPYFTNDVILNFMVPKLIWCWQWLCWWWLWSWWWFILMMIQMYLEVTTLVMTGTTCILESYLDALYNLTWVILACVLDG